MRDGAAEGALLLGALDVDVDPLVVPGRVGEEVDLVLGQLLPVAVAEVLPGLGPELVQSLDDGWHGQTIGPARKAR